jgi:hypothetical protein
VPLIVGVALLVLPGPGLLLVLAGLLVLANAFPAAQRFVRPVRERARKAAEQSVSTRLARVLGAHWRGADRGGRRLVAGGDAAARRLAGRQQPDPFRIILLALLVVSYHRVKGRRASSVS